MDHGRVEAAAKPDPKVTPMDAKAKRKFLWVAGIMTFLSLLIVAGGTFAWIDEHSGTAGTAHVTHCSTSHGIGPGTGQSSVSCDGYWTYKGRTVHGYVENGKYNQIGKDVSARIHGTSHATEQTYWVPIGLWVGGLACAGLFGWLMVRAVRRPTAPPTDPAPA